MKVELRRCTEPVEVEVLDSSGAVARVLTYEASFTDENVVLAASMMRDMVRFEADMAERFAGMGQVGEDEAAEAVEDVFASMRPLIDLLLGEGVTDEVAEAVGGPGCVTAMASLWSSLALECAERARPMKAARAERYMDARP